MQLFKLKKADSEIPYNRRGTLPESGGLSIVGKVCSLFEEMTIAHCSMGEDIPFKSTLFLIFDRNDVIERKGNCFIQKYTPELNRDTIDDYTSYMSMLGTFIKFNALRYTAFLQI